MAGYQTIKYITNTLAMDLGHMDQERQNLQSTKIRHNANEILTPPETPSSTKTFETLNIIIPFSAKELTYGDMTGAFPYTSSRGSKYIYVIYDYDSNAILVHPIKSKGALEIKNAWIKLTQRLTIHGHKLKKITY